MGLSYYLLADYRRRCIFGLDHLVGLHDTVIQRVAERSCYSDIVIVDIVDFIDIH